MILRNWEKGKSKYTLPFFKVESPLAVYLGKSPRMDSPPTKAVFYDFIPDNVTCYVCSWLSLTREDDGYYYFFFLKLFPVSLRLYMCGCYRVETSFTFATFCGTFLSFFYSFFLHRRLLVISKTNEKGYEIMFYDLQEYVHSESLFNFLLGFICIKVYILFQQKAWVLCL